MVPSREAAVGQDVPVPADHPMTYAVVEREHRWLLPAPPPGLDPRDALLIEDRYLTGTRLRLRCVTDAEGRRTWKLGHKVVVDPGPPLGVAHTSLYLDDAEAALLGTLPAAALSKTRHRVRHGGRDSALDVFRGDLAGLVTLEVDLGRGPEPPGHDRGHGMAPPDGALAEVTADPRFAGGALATTSRPALRVLLLEHGLDPGPDR